MVLFNNMVAHRPGEDPGSNLYRATEVYRVTLGYLVTHIQPNLPHRPVVRPKQRAGEQCKLFWGSPLKGK